MAKSQNTRLVKCPDCGDTSNLRYVEDTTISRRVIESLPGKLEVESYADCDWDGDKGRLLCRTCGRWFRLPKGVALDFV